MRIPVHDQSVILLQCALKAQQLIYVAHKSQ